ncbi:pyridoxamine 5'-phosphate oxidase family protein [Aestuariivirga litoralis]|uniref:pyridoxamine 5'-phosphate oxidase family protein n=1 Tax=Aestuariivirga litoralis TaxID=2650924 RepID=UPI0018C69625|nr:pyridoxamine 5'-phosphate oxidase family protein [Aestuariivirga litoralis]MBG1232277.1 pyridoxamine 5'-phosphate oxidase family protein [Aestuariivirga litoralis]
MNAPSDKTRIKRLAKRAAYDADTVHAILDAQPFCSVGYIFKGVPFVTPTMQWREGNHIYWHGSSASRALEASEDAEVCVNVTLIDGMVMARSAFNHSVNYRSVMAFGKAFKVSDPAEKEQKMKTFVDTLFPGRWEMLREMSKQEFKATMILGLELNEVSAKVRNGGPGDDEEDFALPIWAGVIPMQTQFLAPMDCPRLPEGLTPPEHVTKYRIG